jgi:hypothetical protein
MPERGKTLARSHVTLDSLMDIVLSFEFGLGFARRKRFWPHSSRSYVRDGHLWAALPVASPMRCHSQSAAFNLK